MWFGVVSKSNAGIASVTCPVIGFKENNAFEFGGVIGFSFEFGSLAFFKEEGKQIESNVAVPPLDPTATYLKFGE